jgi:hypothetical protein
VQKIVLSNAVLDIAATIPPQELRSLEAIHIASALVIRRELTSFVSYDSRLLAAARTAGLHAASPA